MTSPDELRRIKIPEASVKSAIEDWLQVQQNQGRLWFMRVNSGKILADYNGKKRMIKLAPEGTADLMVIRGETQSIPDPATLPAVYWIETKKTGGKQEPAQIAFQEAVEAQGCQYIVARRLDDVTGVLG